jgi:hypothetical protein
MAVAGPDVRRSLHSLLGRDAMISLSRHSSDEPSAEADKHSGTVTSAMGGGSGVKSYVLSRMARRIVAGRRATLKESMVTNGSPPIALTASRSSPDGFVGSHSG